MKKIKCPYCKKKVSYAAAFFEKNRGEHTCKSCGKNSTIFFLKSFKYIIALTVMIALIIMFISITPENINDLMGVVWVVVPFVVLYFVSPFFFRLIPLKRKRYKGKNGEYISGDERIDPTPASGSTRIMTTVDLSGSENRFDTQKTKVIPVVDVFNDSQEFTDISNL